MKKLLAILLTVMLALGCVPAWAEEPEGLDSDGMEAPIDKDTLIVGSTTAMSGNFFSEMFGNNTSDVDVRLLLHGYNLMEWYFETGSYGINPSVISGIAAFDEANGDRTYTIALYDDLVYSDGTPITVADYAFSMLLSMAPEVKAIGGLTVASDFIEGIDEYMSGAAPELTGVRIISPYQMSVTVKAEYRPFFYELALLNYYPYPIHVIAPGCEVADDGAGILIRNADQTVAEPIFTADLLQETLLNPATGYVSHPSVVSGPYTLVSFDADAHVAQFVANPQYKGNREGVRATIPNVIFKPVDPDHMVEALQNGEVDLINKAVSAQNITDCLALTIDGSFASANYTRSGYSFISFNCEKPTVSSPAVRQALAHALDKATLVTSYVGNYGLPVDGYYGLGQWMYQVLSGTVEPPVLPLEEGASAEEQAEYEEQIAAWEELNMDGLTIYDFDLEAAKALLAQDGWTLNRQGGAYQEGVDDVRCKEVNGALVPLDLKMIYPAGNTIADMLKTAFADNLPAIGVALTMEPVPMTDLLDIYYRNVARDCDLIYLATNFAMVFEPSATFNPEDAYQGESNTSAITDQELYDLAVDMRATEPGDTLTYCQKWVAFQQRFTEVLPTLPIYSNVYFDFYTPFLLDYNVNANLTWSQAIIGATFGNPEDQETGDEGELFFD